MNPMQGDLHAQVGVSRFDITPPPGTRWKLWGAAVEDRAVGVHRPLTGTVLTISSGRQRRAIVSLDLCEWADQRDEAVVRGRIMDACELEADQLLLHSTHTHSGQAPALASVDLPGGEHLAEHLELIAARAATATAQAFREAGPGVLTWGEGRSTLAAHRDQEWDGRPVVGHDPAIAAPDTVTIGRVTSPDGEVRAIVVSYACHPTVLGWANRLISPDYVGALRELVESHYDQALVLFLQGASGELAPADQYRDDPGAADRAGRALGHAVLAGLELMPDPDHRLAPEIVVESGAPLGVWTQQPVAPCQRLGVRRLDVALPRRAEPVTLGDQLPEHVRAERLARAEQVARIAGDQGPLAYPVWIWELGELVLVAHPGEAYSWLATTLRRALVPRPVLVANLTNGAGAFYLPPRAAYARPGYTVAQTPAGPGSLELLAAAVLAEFDLPGSEFPSVHNDSGASR
jgi:hypothetical protein